MRLFKGLAAVLLAACVSTSYAQTNTSFSPEQTQAIQKIVHDYLVNNPQVLVQMAQALQKQEQGKWQQTADKTVPGMTSQLYDDSTSPVVGNLDGNVTLVEFFDYQCPHCKDMGPVIDNLMSTDKNLRVVYKMLPIFGKDSDFAAKAALAAFKQGTPKFIEFHDALLKIQSPLTPDVILKIASQVGLNVKLLKTDMKNPALDVEIKQNDALAKKLKLTGTPAFIMAKVMYDQKTQKMTSFRNPVMIPGAVEESMLKKAITEARGG